MKKKLFALTMTAILALSAACLAACGGGGETEEAWHNAAIWLSEDAIAPAAEDPVTFPDERLRPISPVAVHDPSIFQDPADGVYYAFGSHFMVASSVDLIEWDQEVGDGSSENAGQREAQKLYGEGVNWRTVLKKAVAHAGTGMPSTWAPDVEYYDGKYYMYVSLTSGFGSSRSAISRVEADNVLGPYDNEVLIMTSDGSGANNCIDPELFYDKDGGLWMVYGSFYGGVFIKELYNEGENWGLPKEDGMGKLLWTGGSGYGGTVVEGPFVFYNATNGYYYLMTTYGDLSTAYNMRVARSKNPDGPYTDISGTDMAAGYSDANGVKIAGNYAVTGASGQGYAAMGHNSVIKDEYGRYFVVYHSRRQSGNNEPTATHELMVSQLYFNEEGWPVMSPNAYNDEMMGYVSNDQIADTYQVVLHTEGTTMNAARSLEYVFAADGSITQGGAAAGSWTLKDGFYVTITLDGVEYNGVAVPGWEMYKAINGQSGILSITATSDAGRSLWAIGQTSRI